MPQFSKEIMTKNNNAQYPDNYKPETLSLGQQFQLRQLELSLEKMSKEQLIVSCMYTSFLYYTQWNMTASVLKPNIDDLKNFRLPGK